MTVTVSASAPAIAPFRFFDLRVVRSRRLGHSLVRITFGGEELKDFAAGGYDQSLSLFLPHPHQDAPVVPVEEGDGWFAAWRALPEDERAVMRSYTCREQRREPQDEVDIDFALHGTETSAAAAAGGPASRWAGRAVAGDQVLVLGPAVADNTAVRFRPPQDTDWVLLFADETALPAAAAILDRMPRDRKVRAWIEIPHADDRIVLPTLADADITWIVRNSGDRTQRVLDAVRAAELPDGTPYAWIAGESGTVRALRRHLVQERGIDRRSVTFVGYWRLGLSEEQLLAQALSGEAPSDDQI
ncbi:siderophore-interacting protein [Streptomyces sp. A3M-1-3]|uniref:siderophore-interacting protein n=1 Tax=Streptomyces sp. A3M-1-3 TaxID=2962044 RepID=UPI0020B89AB4|nr:siderophore-interacting protein [Streptomyces sp. A3M-1-3]MCP3819572.1 siderophore-interacting protein [Streptomyces sp. A3M-1-3]